MAKRASAAELKARLQRTTAHPQQVAVVTEPEPSTAAPETIDRPKTEPVELYQPPAELVSPPKPESRPQEVETPPAQPAPKDEVKPYSTYLRPSLIEGIKLRAFKQHVKDKEIVAAALQEYFENHPLDTSSSGP